MEISVLERDVVYFVRADDMCAWQMVVFDQEEFERLVAAKVEAQLQAMKVRDQSH